MSLKLIKTEKALYIGEMKGRGLRIESYKELENFNLYDNLSLRGFEYIDNYTFTVDNKRIFFDKQRSYLHIKCFSYTHNSNIYFIIDLKRGNSLITRTLRRFEKSKTGEKVQIKIKI